MAGLECVERRLTKVSEFTIFALEDDIFVDVWFEERGRLFHSSTFFVLNLELHFLPLFPRVPVLCICVVDGKSTRGKRGFRACWPQGPYYKSCYKGTEPAGYYPKVLKGVLLLDPRSWAFCGGWGRV